MSGKENNDTAQKVGRGALYIALGKVVFLFAGASINFVLPRLLSKADYGDYGVVVRWVSMWNMMTVIGLLQTVSKLVSEQPQAVRAIRFRALKLAALAAAVVAGTYGVCALLFAHVEGDDGLIPALIASAFITFGYGIYAVAIGTVNGQKRFRTQALFDIGFSICKVTFILLGAVLLGGLAQEKLAAASFLPDAGAGLGKVGAVAGFASAALVMAVVAHIGVGKLPATEADQAIVQMPLKQFASKLLLFGGMVMVYQFSLNALLAADLFIVKANFHGDQASLVGVYTGALNVAQLPYFGVLAITFVAFPIISSSTFAEDREVTKRYVRTAFRYGALIAVCVCAVVAASAHDILSLIFPKGYSEGALVLTILVFGYALLALHAIGCTILNAAGKPYLSLAATLSGGVFSVVTILLTLDHFGLVAAAVGTTCGAAVGLLLTLIFLYRTTGAAPAALSTARIVVAGALVAAGGMLLQDRGALWAFPFSCGAGVAFLAILVALRELGLEDLRTALAPFRRRRG